jgi:hypothetical protein
MDNKEQLLKLLSEAQDKLYDIVIYGNTDDCRDKNRDLKWEALDLIKQVKKLIKS